jgi:hypothetical protein
MPPNKPGGGRSMSSGVAFSPGACVVSFASIDGDSWDATVGGSGSMRVNGAVHAVRQWDFRGNRKTVLFAYDGSAGAAGAITTASKLLDPRGVDAVVLSSGSDWPCT